MPFEARVSEHNRRLAGLKDVIKSEYPFVKFRHHMDEDLSAGDWLRLPEDRREWHLKDYKFDIQVLVAGKPVQHTIEANEDHLGLGQTLESSVLQQAREWMNELRARGDSIEGDRG